MAKISEITPNVRQFEYRQERGDPDYGSCMWASFVLDCENYTLYIASDCGDYAYSWAPTPKSESFEHLMSRIYGDYLLEKIESMSVFDYEKSFNHVIECLKDNDASEEEIEKFKERMVYECAVGLAQIVDEEFKTVCYEALEDIGQEGIIEYDDYGCCFYDYPGNARKIVEIFCKYIQPLLQENAENGSDSTQQ